MESFEGPPSPVAIGGVKSLTNGLPVKPLTVAVAVVEFTIVV